MAAPPSGESLVHRALPIYLALLFALLTAAAIVALVHLRHVLVILFVSLLFAAALSGPAARLERLRVPRAVAVALIYLTALAVIVVTGWLVLPRLFEQLAAFGDRAPEYVERYERLRTTYEDLREDYPALESFDRQIAEITSAIIGRAGGRLLDLPGDLFELFLDVLSVFVISMLLVTNRDRLLGFALSLVHPSDRERVREVATKMWVRIGAYLRAKVIVMAIVGFVTWLALVLIGVPFAVPLAIVVAFGETIPRAGPWLARIPLLGIAALEGPGTLGLTFLASVVIENAKGYVISPIVEGEQLDIHPLLVFVSVLVGASLLGVAGAFIAVPAAAMIEVFFTDVVVPWRRRRIAPAETPSPSL